MNETKDEHCLSTEGEGICECCGQKKQVRMYMLQNMEAAFVCKLCRNEKNK